MTMLIFDFDGTVTDAEREGLPFRKGYLEDIAILTGRDVDEIESLAAQFEATVQAEKGQHGWMFNGHIVAPATVDPYLRIMPVARMIFDHTGTFSSEEDRSRLLDGILYKYNYQKTEIAFKPEAKSALLRSQPYNTHILSNSHTDPIRHKIDLLGREEDGSHSLDWLLDRVFGRAKKYVIDDSFDAVPATMSLPGLERPVLLRRKLYYDALERLREKHDVAWSSIVVVGDIFELDLSLPLAMGARVCLVKNQFTPSYEMDFLQSHERGYVLSSLDDLFPILEG
jgi:FMN phosphatase YigB (HAD superfamily)